MLTAVKLAAGQAWSAWRQYPAARRALLTTRPGPPILVTGPYRSGTSWVGAMLAPAGLWHLHEPFNPNRGLWGEELAYADAGAPRAALDAFVHRLVRGGHRGALRLPRSRRWYAPLRLLPIRPKRVLLKDPSAAFLSEYLVRRHGMQAVVLFRHPAAVASSLLGLGWPTGELVQRMLADEALMEGPLARMRTSMAEAASRRDALSAAVFHGCVAHVLWWFSERNPEAMIRLSYEELCRDPEGGFRRLFQRLGLDRSDRSARVHGRLTAGAASGEYDPFGVVRASAAMPGTWPGRMRGSDLAVVRDVWERFEVPLYRDAAEWDPAIKESR